MWRPLAGRLAAEVAGADSAARMVFVHGFTQTGNSWKAIAEHFVRAGHQCVVLDLPGHGGSTHLRADLRRTADMVASVGGQGVYVGYSLGARVALHVALLYPHEVDAVALVGANPGIDSDTERAVRREADDRLAAHLEQVGLQQFLEEWTAQPLFGTLTPQQLDLDDRLRNTVEGLASSLRHAGTGTQMPLWSRLRELSMPVLAMAGADDAKFAAIAQQMADAVPDGRSVLVPDAAHAAHLQQPASVIDAIERWLLRRPV
ncbi:MAG: putative 2-succinyl-6-hydroxy-2,4-cyclohexadiene-carboxylate synthase [Actinomycetota bacterium]